MGSSETLCLRWNEYESNIKQGFSLLRSNEDFFDVTLTCGVSQIKAHRVVLSACSSFFRSLLKSIPHEHPFLYLRGIQGKHLEAILAFMYNGEVRVKPEELEDFLLCAQELKVNGLMQEPSGSHAPPIKNEAIIMPKEEEMNPSGVKREFPHHQAPVPSLKKKRPPLLRQEEDSDIEEIDPLPQESVHHGDEYMTYPEDEPVPSEALDSNNSSANHDVSRDQLLDAELMKYVSPRDANNVYKCMKCSYSSVNRLNVKKHVEARHFVTDGFKCDKCSRVFKTRETLSKHFIKVHKGESVYFSTAS